MLVPPSVFKMHGCGDPEAIRYVLSGIHLERHGSHLRRPRAVATDGSIILVTSWDEPDPSEYPREDGFNPCGRAGFETNVPETACREIFKETRRLRTVAKRKPILGYVALDEHRANGTLPAMTTDLETPKKTQIKPLEGRYPRYGDCLASQHNQDNSVSVRLGGRNLERLLEAMLAQSNDPLEIVFTLRLDDVDPEEENPKPLAARARGNMVTLTAETAEGIKMIGAIMPCDNLTDLEKPLLPLHTLEEI